MHSIFLIQFLNASIREIRSKRDLNYTKSQKNTKKDRGIFHGPFLCFFGIYIYSTVTDFAKFLG